jgi:hypothetical protein
MSWYRKNPLFAAGISLCGLLALAELGFTYERYAAWRGAEKKLRDQTNELQGMSSLMPPPTRDVATAIEADLAKAQASLAAMQNELKGHGAAAERLRAAKAPTARTDAYFDLATFVEKMHELAKKNDIVVKSEAARFGFEIYKNEGPELDRVEPVFRQRQIAQYLIESLLDAKPRAILSVKRERTMTKEEKQKRDEALANNQPPPEESSEDGPDYFTIDPRRTARVPGFVDATAFRISFLGQTSALRAFLNRLASFELPVLVREVEVETATAEEAAAEPTSEETPAPEQPAAAPAAGAAPPSVVLSTEPAAPGVGAPKPAAAPKPRAPTATPIVTKPLSKFTVTVEYIELVTPQPPADANAAPAQPPSE